MRKRLLLVLAIFIACTGTAFAEFNYQFDIVSFDPLHKEYFADRAKSELSISYLNYFEGFPDRVLQDGYISEVGEVNTIKVWKFNKTVTPEDKMIYLKIGETASLARSTFTFDHWLSPFAFDFSMQGTLQEFFKGGFDDNFGYDGIFFIGGTFRIADKVSMRIGRHHYCSHYGDATLKQIQDLDPPSANPPFSDFWLTYKYVRMDSMAFGLSIDATPNLRVYGELNYPPRWIKSVRPDMFAPNWITRNGITVNPGYPDSYNARIINVGFELDYPIFKKLGSTTFGYDLHMYEEGKIIYNHETGDKVIDDNGVAKNYYFDKYAPWEFEHNIKLAQEISNEVSVEVTYHNGRSPFNNYYFQHTSYISIGARFNPKSTVTLF